MSYVGAGRDLPLFYKFEIKMKDKLTFLTLHGSFKYNTAIEDFFVNALCEIVKDNALKALKSKYINEVFVVSNKKEFLNDVKTIGVKTEFVKTEIDFHFGKTIKVLINKHKFKKLFYIGAGAAPLITQKEVNLISREILARENIIIANNFYSSDFFAVSPAKAWNKVGARHGAPLPATDNPFAYRLKEAGNLEQVKLKPSCGTFLDIDTPVDLAILSLHPGCGKYTKEFLGNAELPLAPTIKKIKQIPPYFYDPFSEVFIFGRVGSVVPNYIMSKAKCRFRLISEECGMKAWGREERGEVTSFMGSLIDKIGFNKFFKELAKTSRAAFMDTRVLFAHKKLNASRADRFYSDLGLHEKVKDRYIKTLTYEAQNADIPVILGGHSLVSGGLYTLMEISGNKIK